MTMTGFVTRPFAPRPALGITVLAVVLFLIRLTGPSDLIDYGQEAPTSYVLDAVQNGHWLVQWDVRGNLTSKPPLYTWLAAAVSTATGTVNRWTLCLPAGVATLGLALVIFAAGQKCFGRRAGFLAALIYILSPVAAKQVALVRTDGLFSLTVALTALLACRAWQQKKGWTLFWLAAALATLTKGPLGVLLGAAGLLAAGWERQTGNPMPVRGRHGLGVFLFVLIVLGWFGLAYWEAGGALTDRMLVRELYGRAVSKGEGSRMGAGFYLPTLYFLSRFAPWSLITVVALWRVVKRPSLEVCQRRTERFWFCWLVAGLVLFSLAAHQRADLIFPLIPPAALLAGRELDRWLAGWSNRKFVMATTIISLAALAATGLEYHIRRLRNEAVAQTLAAQTLAGLIREKVGGGFPVVFMDASPVLQMELGTVSPLVTPERAAALLQGKAAAFVAVKDAGASLGRLPANAFQILAVAPRTARTHMAIVGNRPALAWADPLATVAGPLRLELNGIRNYKRRGQEFWFENTSRFAHVELTNESDQVLSVRIHFAGQDAATSEEVILPPGETRKATCTR